MRIALTFLTLFLATAAAPAPDPLLAQLLAGARAEAPAGMAFQRTARTTGQEDGGKIEDHVRIDRWDGKQLTLVSIDGRTPTREESEEARKAAATRPVPGYYRLAVLLGTGARRIADAKGRIVYRVEGLPKGSITVGKDISADVVADAVVDNTGPHPFVASLQIALPQPISIMLVARIDKVDAVSTYRMGADGRPSLVHQMQTVAGAKMGSASTTRTESTYTALR
jgi:hypothetical protein